MSNNNATVMKKELPPRVKTIGLGLLGTGGLLGILSFFIDKQFALFSYLWAFILIMTLAIGCLFLMALEYISGADWSVPFRRVNEFFSSLIPLLFILAIPLVLNMHDLFHWSHIETVQSDKVLASKAPYLNPTFFIIRVGVTFGLWSLFYFLFTRNSRLQDTTGDQSLTFKNGKLGAIFIPVFAITLTMMAIDWVMSLEPHWFSTIFGVYFFAGSVLTSLSAVTVAALYLKKGGYLHPDLQDGNFYSLGALLFAFINFWAYIAFSQYLLIWYANLPEETYWFLNRWQGGWTAVSIAMIFVHFIVPYSVLLSQPAKMNPFKLKFAAIWILAAHALDCYWLIMPNLHLTSFNPISVILQFAFPVAAVGLVILVFYFNAKKYNLTPIGDPKLLKGLNNRA